MAVVEVVRDGDIAVVTLNRPEVLNAVNAELRDAFIAAMRALNDAAAVHGVVITGAGERALSAGQDLDVSRSLTAASVGDWFRALRGFYQAVRDMQKPTVVAINGVAAGAGLQLSLHADYRVAHPEVRMAQPEIDAGIPSILGSMIMREAMGLSRTAEMALSCRLVEAEEAHDYGLVNEVAAREEVLPRAKAVARELGAKPPVAMRLSKQWLRELTQPAFDEAVEAAVRLAPLAFEAGEPQRAAEAFMARRAARKPAAR